MCTALKVHASHWQRQLWMVAILAFVGGHIKDNHTYVAYIYIYSIHIYSIYTICIYIYIIIYIYKYGDSWSSHQHEWHSTNDAKESWLQHIEAHQSAPLRRPRGHEVNTSGHVSCVHSHSLLYPLNSFIEIHDTRWAMAVYSFGSNLQWLFLGRG